jgi:glyceraldehyde-3-phosphate dehydrogenase/erythrose-4-phosphate dehydrogenase
MNADSMSDDDLDTEAEFDEESETEEEIVDDDEDSDNVGDASVEINVEELITELESNGLVVDCTRDHETKRRLEDLMEKRWAKKALEDFDDYEL